MRPITVTVGPLASASANAIALSQTPSAGPLTLNGASVSGGVAVLDNARRVLITSVANESGNTFTITGTGRGGIPQTDVVTGPNAGTAQSNLDFVTVTRIAISGNAVGAITVGTNTVASSQWVRFDEWGESYVTIQCNASGTVNYTIQTTLDDPNSPTNPVSPSAMTWLNTNDTSAVGATTSIQSNFLFLPIFARVTLNSGTGSVTSTFVQTAGVML